MKISDRETRTHISYTAARYEQEVRDVQEWPPAMKGAEIAAASKRWKQEVIYQWLMYIGERENLDITPTLANHLARAFMGRSISRPQLLKWFGIEGRTAAEKSEDHSKYDDLVEKYSVQVAEEIGQITRQMKSIRDAVKEEMEKAK